MAVEVTVRRMPQQVRAEQRIARIVEAAHKVYHEVGRDRFNTDLVAREAGCAIGTLYRYFPDRVALMDAIAPTRPFV